MRGTNPVGFAAGAARVGNAGAAAVRLGVGAGGRGGGVRAGNGAAGFWTPGEAPFITVFAATCGATFAGFAGAAAGLVAAPLDGGFGELPFVARFCTTCGIAAGGALAMAGRFTGSGGGAGFGLTNLVRSCRTRARLIEREKSSGKLYDSLGIKDIGAPAGGHLKDTPGAF